MFDMAAFETKKDDARTNRTDAANNHSSAEAKNQKARVKLGIGDGQTSNTPDTCYNILTLSRDLLLVIHQENEERLNAYGFNVVISEARSPTKRHAKASS